MCLTCALIWLTSFCYFANTVTDRIASIGDIAYDSNWIDYPLNLQKFITVIVTRSQRPVYFSGLNLVPCTMETYGKVIKMIIYDAKVLGKKCHMNSNASSYLFYVKTLNICGFQNNHFHFTALQVILFLLHDFPKFIQAVVFIYHRQLKRCSIGANSTSFG